MSANGAVIFYKQTLGQLDADRAAPKQVQIRVIANGMAPISIISKLCSAAICRACMVITAPARGR
jgi:hypothetical protein